MALPNGPSIRCHRQRRGKTIAQLAEAVDVTYVHLANVERGHNTCSVEVLWRIANTLGLDDINELVAEPEANGGGAGTHPQPTHPPRRTA